MRIESHTLNDIKIAELIADGVVIETAEDGLNLLGNIYHQDFDKLIIHAKNITPDFFDLETGIAGELLQKFSNYRVSLAVVGDFTSYSGKSIKDFIFESNKVGQINFANSTSDAIDKLSRH